jgi:hypothetical protein
MHNMQVRLTTNAIAAECEGGEQPLLAIPDRWAWIWLLTQAIKCNGNIHDVSPVLGML